MPDENDVTQAAGEEPVAEAHVPDEAAAAAGFEPVEAEIVDTEALPAEAADAPVEDVVPEEPDWHDRYLRAAAELDNVRKRARRDAPLAEQRGTTRLARELLPALDNLDRAIAAAEAEEADTEHHLTKGIRLVQKELVAALARVGIEPFDPSGQLFDPHRHEALAQQPREGVASGTIVEVYQQGYRLGEDVLRPAKVVVAA